jgi:2-hydroxychromene-2-carboxylate isomerase
MRWISATRRLFERCSVVRASMPTNSFAPVDDQSTKDELRRATEVAVERGVFDAPAFFVGEGLFWGNDRLNFVERALRA